MRSASFLEQSPLEEASPPVLLLKLVGRLGLKPENTMTSFKHTLARVLGIGISLIPIRAAAGPLACETKAPPARGIRACVAWFRSKIAVCRCCKDSRPKLAPCVGEPVPESKANCHPQGKQAAPIKSFR